MKSRSSNIQLSEYLAPRRSECEPGTSWLTKDFFFLQTQSITSTEGARPVNEQPSSDYGNVRICGECELSESLCL